MNETGLPELPVGYFWRVSTKSSEYVTVAIRKKRLFGSRCVEWSCFRKANFADYGHSAEGRIRQSAEYVLEEFSKGEMATRTFHEFDGDYPPKKLGA